MPNRILFRLKFRLFFLFLGLREVLVDTLIKVDILNEQIIAVGSEKLARQKLFQDFALELLNNVLAIHSQYLLLHLLRQLLKLIGLVPILSICIVTGLNQLRFCGICILRLLLRVRYETFDIDSALHVVHHLSQGVCCCYQQVDMSVCRFSWHIRVFHANLSQSVISVGEAGIGYDLGEGAL